MKAAVKTDAVSVSVEPVAVHIDIAAQMLGISRRSFYDHFITPRLVMPIYVGARAMIDVEQLRAAWREYSSSPQAMSTRPDDQDAA